MRPQPADSIQIRNIAINVTVEFQAGFLQANAQKNYRFLFSSDLVCITSNDQIRNYSKDYTLWVDIVRNDKGKITEGSPIVKFRPSRFCFKS